MHSLTTHLVNTNTILLECKKKIMHTLLVSFTNKVGGVMNKLPVYILVSIVLINIFLHLKASNGCMDTSWHLEKRFDYKEYHTVECNCPCWKYKELSDRNRCSKCLHYHKPEAFGVRKPDNAVYALKKQAIKQKAKTIIKKRVTQKTMQQNDPHTVAS